MNAQKLGRHRNLIVVGRGEAKSSSLHRTLPRVVRFADETAWLTAEAIADALGKTSDDIGQQHSDIGVISVRADGPVSTLRRVAQDMEKSFISPLKFPAANPATIAGLPCIAFVFHGPSLNITMPPTHGVGVAVLLADAWLHRGIANVVSLVTHMRISCRVSVARCLLVATVSSYTGFPEDLQSDVQWLEGAYCEEGA